MGVTSRDELTALLRDGDARFFSAVAAATDRASDLAELLALASWRRRAKARGLVDTTARRPLRLAILGGYGFHPLAEAIEQCLWAGGHEVELFVGEYDNHVHEILEETSALYAFRPEIAFLLPPARRCHYSGALTDERALQEGAARVIVTELLGLCDTLHRRSGAEILLANFMLPPGLDPGAYRVRTLGSDWSFRKLVNLELGLAAPPSVHLCDLELLAYRRGGLAARDDRRYFESKQPGSAELLVDLAREVALLVRGLRQGPRKVLALDLDDTLWGGTVGDVGTEGIELGDTSPRGEAFKAFQRFVASLKSRGVLLAVCSKNDHDKAMEPFDRHPEMVLRRDDIVAFRANWRPKPDNLREIAAELNLGTDALVFVDDNPAEIEIVRQSAPEIATVLLGPDPADYVRQLEDARFFEPRTITGEDAQRTRQYQADARREVLLASATDMSAYLASLEMVATIGPFRSVDVPRISQLINRSNQFNLTTRRRTEAEVQALIGDPRHVTFTVRLGDRFGDHGLIAVLIGRLDEDGLDVDTWLMSCRVLNRQVEEETVRELVRLAREHAAPALRGRYLPTPKNRMVRDLFPRMGFTLSSEEPTGAASFLADPQRLDPPSTHIRVTRSEAP
jgi:FkbH-like protein